MMDIVHAMNGMDITSEEENIQSSYEDTDFEDPLKDFQLGWKFWIARVAHSVLNTICLCLRCVAIFMRVY